MFGNDRGYANLRFAGASLSQSKKVNVGANASKCKPAGEHR